MSKTHSEDCSGRSSICGASWRFVVISHQEDTLVSGKLRSTPGQRASGRRLRITKEKVASDQDIRDIELVSCFTRWECFAE